MERPQNYNELIDYKEELNDFYDLVESGNLDRAREILKRNGGLIDLQFKCAYQNKSNLHVKQYPDNIKIIIV